MIAYPVVNGRLDWGSGYYVDSILRRIELERLARTGDIGTAESKSRCGRKIVTYSFKVYQLSQSVFRLDYGHSSVWGANRSRGSLKGFTEVIFEENETTAFWTQGAAAA